MMGFKHIMNIMEGDRIIHLFWILGLCHCLINTYCATFDNIYKLLIRNYIKEYSTHIYIYIYIYIYILLHFSQCVYSQIYRM